MLGAVDLGVADDGECAGHEQAAEIAVALFADAAEPVLCPHSSAASERAQSRPRSYVLIGRSWGQQHSRPERSPASDRPRECNEGACSFWLDRCQAMIIRSNSTICSLRRSS